MDKDRLHSICGCSTTELNKSIKAVRETSSKKIEQFKSESTSVGRTSKRGKTSNSIQEGKKKEENNKKEGEVENKKKRKITQEKVIKPVSGIVSMINHQDYLNTKRYADYQKWRSSLIHQLTEI